VKIPIGSPLRLYPRAWRDRYEPEVLELLEISPHPWRDRANLAAHAPTAWLEALMANDIPILAVTAVALVWFGFTLGQLAGGPADIPSHWWSSASTLTALGALGASTRALVRRTTI
jgi:hypothetical protein